MLRTFAIVASLALLLAVSVGAQTRTVPGDHATVQAAIDFFDPDPDGGTPNVIQITDSSVYDEVITIDVPVTIEGTNLGDARPVIAAQLNTTGGNDDGVVISIPTGTFNDVTLRNLFIIPSLTSTPTATTSDGLLSVGQNLNILLENVVITANNGADRPVSTDGLTPVSMAGATTFGDDGAFLGGFTAPAGDGTLVTMRNTVLTHNQSLQNLGTTGEGLVCSGSSGGGYNIEDGCVFSYNGRLGIQGNGSFRVDAPNDPVIVMGNGTNPGAFAGIWFAGTGSGLSPVRELDGIIVIGHQDPDSFDQGWGIEQQNGDSIPFVLRNAVIAGNNAHGLNVGSATTDGLITLENVTFVNNGLQFSGSVAAGTPDAQAAIFTDPGHTGNITITDCVIAGNGGADPSNSIVHNGTGTITINNSAIVTAGPQSLTSATAGTGTVNQSGIVNTDPAFLNVSGSAVALDLGDITNVTDYLTAATAGAPLGGGATVVQSLDQTTNTIVVDGDASDWTSALAPANGEIALDATTQELIFNDATNDDLGDGDYAAPTDAAFNDTESDIEEVRIAHDGQNLYVLVRTGAYGTGFGGDLETAMTQVAVGNGTSGGSGADDFGAFSDLRLDSIIEWDAVFGLGETGSGVSAFSGGDFGNSITVVGAQDETNAVVEFCIPVGDIGFPNDEEIAVVVGQGHSSGAAFRDVNGGAAGGFAGGGGDPASAANGLTTKVYDLANPGAVQTDQNDVLQDAHNASLFIPVVLTNLIATPVEGFELYR